MDSKGTLEAECVKGTTNSIANQVDRMIKACHEGNSSLIEDILKQWPKSVSEQDKKTGRSPLMAAASAGHLEICRTLLDLGAPWNALDRNGKCAGNYATDAGFQDVVDLLVDAGVKAELVLGATMRSDHKSERALNDSHRTLNIQSSSDPLIEQEPSTKPDFLDQSLRYDGDALLDQDNDAVMMGWERPLMKLHASVITSSKPEKRVLNVGFGMGIIDAELQKLKPSLHVIIEAHPDVHAMMLSDGWGRKEHVRICKGKWQVELPKLIDEGLLFDGVFFDTYGEHYTDMEDFHRLMVKSLSRPDGIYSFFNGLAPDNIFFHGVACQCVKLQLSTLGLETEFVPCEIEVKEKEWKNVRRKYWHGNTYYLPICRWKHTLLKTKDEEPVGKQAQCRKRRNEGTDDDRNTDVAA